MPAEVKKEIALEIAHVLFIDIVAYSKMASDDQRAAIEKLNQIVQSTDEFRKAEGDNRLLKLATGDGMVLIFYDSPEAPVECALEISRALKEHHPQLRLRMGAHSGPVSGMVDVNGRANVAGAGINTAQRVMDCGDAGHILLSKRVAEDLEQFKHWRPHLYHIGECEVKHGDKIEIVNLFTAELGNSERPKRMAMLAQKTDLEPVRKERAPSRKPVLIIAACLALAALAVAAFLFWQQREPKTSTAGLGIPEKSIAVLPFENLSDEKQNAFFTDGVQDEILTDLAKIADLKVISRSSVMQYKSGVARDLRKIGQELGVAHLLEGSVQRAANRVRVNAQLIDARNDAHLWAQTYDRDLADVFAIQSEIAKAIADQLQAKISPSEINAIERTPTADVTAFDLYTQAKTLLLNTSFSAKGLSNMLQAVDLLNRAIARDPSFFQAYCVLASAHDSIYFLGNEHTPARLAAAEAAIESASRMRPDAGETHLARAENLYRGYYDYDGALAELDIARRTLPNDSRIPELAGYIVRRRGKQEEGLQYLLRSLELDPRNFLLLQQTALSYQILQRYAEMARVLDRGLAIKPDDIETRAARAVVELDWKADTRPVHQLMEELRARDPAALKRVADTWFTCALAERDPVAAEAAISALGESPYNYNQGAIYFNHLVLEGLIARMMNDEAKARAAFTAARAEQEKFVLAQPNHGPALCVLGLIDAALGRKDEALREARRAVELLPIENDATRGIAMVKYLAMIAAWVGDKDLACEQLAIAVRNPSDLSYVQLKLMQFWDPLRGDPRFEKIVASLAPK